MKPKFKLTTALLIGCMFTFVGLVFSAVGIGFYFFGDPSGVTGVFDSPEKNFMILCTTFAGIGMFLFVFGIVLLVKAVLDNRKIKALIEAGHYVYAEVVAVRYNLLVSINHKHPQYVECKYVDPYTQKEHLFRSGDRMQRLNGMEGRSVRVFVDPGDYTNYYVDLEDGDGVF